MIVNGSTTRDDGRGAGLSASIAGMSVGFSRAIHERGRMKSFLGHCPPTPRRKPFPENVWPPAREILQ